MMNQTLHVFSPAAGFLLSLHLHLPQREPAPCCCLPLLRLSPAPVSLLLLTGEERSDRSAVLLRQVRRRIERRRPCGRSMRRWHDAKEEEEPEMAA